MGKIKEDTDLSEYDAALEEKQVIKNRQFQETCVGNMDCKTWVVSKNSLALQYKKKFGIYD